jgi:hypothetical protein
LTHDFDMLEKNMGGRRGGSRNGKKKCEHTMSIDVRRLKRRGWLELGASATLTWGESSIMIKARAEHVLACWTGAALMYTEKLPIIRTAQPFGGERAWWSCPGCSSRCALLYMRSMRWRCRACHRLAYASTLERCPIEQARRKHCRVLRKLGITDPAVLRSPVFNAPRLPARPKGMHHVTYSKLAMQHLELHRQAIMAIRSALGF